MIRFNLYFFKIEFLSINCHGFFTIEQVSNASFSCYPNNSLSSFTNFLPEKIHLKGEWEVAFFQKNRTLPCTKTLQSENLLSEMDEKVLRKKYSIAAY